MNVLRNLCLLVVVVLLAITSLSCIPGGTATPAPAGPGATATGQSTGVPQGLTPQRSTPAGGSAADPAAGLEQLRAYQAVLTLGFDGTDGGQPAHWSQSYTLTVNRDDNTRLLVVNSTGLPADAAPNGWLQGTSRQMILLRDHAGMACSAFNLEGNVPPEILEPAALLPVVQGGTPAGDETRSGQNTRHVTFDHRAAGFPEAGTAAGDMWLAVPGNYIVAFTLRAEGGPDFFEQDIDGVMTWEYELAAIDADPVAAVPDDCPAGVVDAAIMDRAQSVTRRPGFVEFTAEGALADVVRFYQDDLPARGYTAFLKPIVVDDSARMIYTRAGLTLNVLATQETEQAVSVRLLLARGEPELAASEPEPPQGDATPEPSGDANTRLNQAITLLLGSGNTPGVLPAYHLEVTEALPAAANGALNTSAVQISAGVQGANYYLKQTVAGQVKVEGYLVDGSEYILKNGKLTQGYGDVALAWVFWPLDVITPYGIAALGPAPQGRETIAGRAADKFALDSAGADPELLAAIQGANPFATTRVISAKGTAWIDVETGALLKLSVDYMAVAKNAADDSNAIAGHVELLVDQVGKAEVSLP